MKKTEINVGDVVEIKYRPQPSWNGIQFRVTKIGALFFKGTVVKTTSSQETEYPIGSEFKWSCCEGLVVVDPENDPPSSNQVYIDHIYERLVKNITPEELISLAARLDRAGKGISL